MRGRTNLPSGITLNATTSAMKVAEENGIVAGDFVEYYTNTCVKTLVDGYFNYVDIINSDYIVGVDSNEKARLIKVNGQEMEVTQTLTDKSYSSVRVEGDNIWIYSNDSNAYKLTLFNIENNILVEKGVISKLYSFTYAPNGNKVLVFDNDYNITLYDYKNGSFNNLTSKTTGYYLPISGFTYAEGNKYIFSAKYYSNPRVAIITHNEIDNTLTLSDIDVKNVDRFTTYNLRPLKIGRKIYSVSSKTVSSGESYYLVSIDLDTNIAKSDKLETMGLSDLATTNITFSDAYNEYYFIASTLSSSHLSTYKYNPQSDSFERLSDMSEGSKLQLLKIGDTLYATGRYSDKQISVMTIINNVISNNTDKTIVKRWAGTNNPVGVAKNSGSNGSYINVYVPSSTY